MTRRMLLLLAAIAAAAHAQFQLFSVTGAVEMQVPPVFSFGQAIAGDPVATLFRVRNVSSTPASMVSLALAGQGFTLVSPPRLPQTLAPQTALDFTVQFQANVAGTYSAGLTLPGISVILTATVVSELSYSVTSPVDFGPVVHGTTATIHVVISDLSTVALAIPPLTIYGAAFSLVSPPPAGFTLQPQQNTTFDLRFSPSANGSYSGTLIAGDRTFALTGMGVDPPPPNILLSVDVPQASCGAQGTLKVSLDAPAPSSASGTLTLDFQGPDDPGAAFAAGGRSLSLAVSAGDTEVLSAPFQMGTTAGTLVFTATLGTVTAQTSVPIAPAPVTLCSASAMRSAGTVTVQITGFDNTRTAGPLAFTFFDQAGSAIPPTPIQVTADFTDFFQTSGLGGLFVLKAVFPVNGDPSQVAAFDVQMTNTVGATSTGKTAF